MNSLQSLILCIVYAAFLVLGAITFMHIEYEISEKLQVKELREWTRLKELALLEDSPEDELLALAMWLPKNCSIVPDPVLQTLISPGSQAESVKEIEKICPHIRNEDSTVTVLYPWSFIDALYFSMTVSTTIGYGHISPSGNAGKVVCMIYALVGIPLTGILLAWTSEFFGEKLFQLFKSKLDSEKQHSKRVIAAATVIYIAIGFLVFVFVPAIIFTAIEDWSYLESVYYCFITLTTIGFGDFVTGNRSKGSSYLYVYQVGVILWIMIGLGYWVMVANFIMKALQSKKLQSSVLRSAEEMKKIMQQMGIKNNDPRFLRQHSKATVNFMLQLSNIIAVQGGMDPMMKDDDDPESPSSPGGTSTTTSSSGPFSPVSSPHVIPGISALFGPNINRTNPLAQLIGPLGLAKYVMKPRTKPCDEREEHTQTDTNEMEEAVNSDENNEEHHHINVFTISGNSKAQTPMIGHDNAAYINEISAESQKTLHIKEEPV
ncbi:potassium channel subfamily K member 1-like isoform X1 [Macrobrachium rosenbergii]|uniref:potassium channel subfamily K member 1-like isoform X1 n=1 Tax=Macrobrachium rosenbergii TaxID=79674 RepID=UPI0034D5D789